MLLYGISRFIIEFYRGDPRGMVGALSTSQFVSILIVPLAIIMLVVLGRAPDRPAGGRRKARAGGVDAVTRDATPRELVVEARARRHAPRPLPDGAAAGTLARPGAAADQGRPRHRAPRRRVRPSTAGPRRPDIRRRRARRRAPPAPSRRPCRSSSSTRIRDIVVLDKPAGMVVHPAAGHSCGTLVNALLHHVKDLSGIGGEMRPGIVHRLDRGTSGPDGRGQERPRAPGAVAAVPRSRGREGIRGAGVGAWSRPGSGSTSRSAATRAAAEDVHAGAAGPQRRHARHLRAALPGSVAAQGGDRHRPHAPDSRAPERHRASDRRRFDLRRRSTAGWRTTCAR